MASSLIESEGNSLVVVVVVVVLALGSVEGSAELLDEPGYIESCIVAMKIAGHSDVEFEFVQDTHCSPDRVSLTL